MDTEESKSDTNLNHGKAGKFVANNKAAKGKKTDADVADAMRDAIKRALTRKAMTTIARKLIDNAKDGDRLSIKEVFDRITGRASGTEMLRRIEALERQHAEQQAGGGS